MNYLRFTAIFITLPTLAFAGDVAEPYAAKAAAIVEAASNFQGGVSRGNATVMRADASLAVDTSAANWWQGGEWFVQVLADAGKSPSELTGDLQAFSNIDTEESFKIFQFWYQHNLLDDHCKLLFGLHDLNSTFYALDSAALFTHSSFGIGPDLSQVGPSIFPTTALTLHATFTVDDNYALVAIYDGIPGDPNNAKGTHVRLDKGDGLFKIIEAGVARENGDKLAIGTWKNTAHVENSIDGQWMDNNYGAYIIGQKSVSDATQVFMQLGYAANRKNSLDRYVGMGIAHQNLWHEGDNAGLGVAQAHNSRFFLAANPDFKKAETTWDFTYAYPLGPWK